MLSYQSTMRENAKQITFLHLQYCTLQFWKLSSVYFCFINRFIFIILFLDSTQKCYPKIFGFDFLRMMDFPGSSVGKESTYNAGDPGLIPGSGRSPGEGKVYPLQYPGLENSMDCIVHGVTKSRTGLSDFRFRYLVR